MVCNTTSVIIQHGFFKTQSFNYEQLTSEQKFNHAIYYFTQIDSGDQDESYGERAIFWFKQAIKAGHHEALGMLLNALMIGIGTIRKDLAAWEKLAKEEQQYDYLGRRFAHVFKDPDNPNVLLIKQAVPVNLDKAVSYLRCALYDEDIEVAQEAFDILQQGLIESKWAFQKNEQLFNQILQQDRVAILRICEVRLNQHQDTLFETLRNNSSQIFCRM